MKNFFQHMKIKYNNETCIRLKDYCRQQKRLAKQTESLKYLLSCREYGIIPKHLTNTTTRVQQLFRTDTIKNTLENVRHKFHLKVLNLEITQTTTNIRILKRNIEHNKMQIKTTINEGEYGKFISDQRNMHKHITSQTKYIHSTKLYKLKNDMLHKLGFTYNADWFVNMTDIELPEESKWLLSLGEKFALPIHKNNFSPLHLIADIEQCIQTIPDDRDKEAARLKMAGKISTFNRNMRNTQREKFILVTHEKTQKLLRRYTDKIIITRSDKGNKTVVMYRNDYNNKMEKLLEDKFTYKKIRIDPTTKLQKVNNNIVNDLFKGEYIGTRQKQQYTCSAALAPRLYGLPKIHKPGLPIRPISSSTSVPCYNLAKHIGQILRNIVSDTYNIKNTYELKDRLQKVEVGDDEILVSFDAVSLFTNIPTYLAIRQCMHKWNIISQFTKIPKQKFLQILQFCLRDNNYFIYNGNIYNQTFGMPMGNPLSPTIADIILDNLLDNALDELKTMEVHIKCILKYVDDIIAIIKRKDLEQILTTFNQYHDKLKFTVEKEIDGKIPYLDTTLHREKSRITLNWYTKDMASGRLMNYNSTQPRQQKINTASNLINKIIDISDEKFMDENIQKIKTILKNNDYPHHLIDNLIKRKLHPHNTNKCSPQTTEQSGNTRQYFSIPFIPNLTNTRQLKTTITQDNTIFAHKSNKTLRQIFSNTKDQIDKQQQYDVVYEVECNGSDGQKCGQIYIGTTKRALGVRISEHQSDIRNSKMNTALSQHILETGHKANFENVRILDKERRVNTRYTIESLRIQQNLTKTMNTKEDKDKTNLIYSVVI